VTTSRPTKSPAARPTARPTTSTAFTEGHIKVKGDAPDNVAWWLGIRPDGTPNEVFLGDWRVA
jgi:hypothetical protein